MDYTQFIMQVPKTLQEAIQHFSDAENCREFMLAMRWPDGRVQCPYCGSEKLTWLAKARVYRCYGDHPKQKFSLKVGTVFEDSPIGLEKWLPATWLLCNSKNGISSYELHRALGVTQKTAWFMLHRIRLAMQSKSFGKFGSGSDGGPVEADETFVGGTPKYMHKSRKLKLKRKVDEVASWKNSEPYPGKVVVMGMLDRELRQVRATVVPNIRRETLQEQILKEVERGANLYTDGATTYHTIAAQNYVHETVSHIGEYVRGQVHTNGIENFWSCLKRSLKGTYVAVEPFHLSRYVDEQTFRFNNRATKDNPLDDADRFMLAMSQIAGKRLPYAELTGKVGETTAF